MKKTNGQYIPAPVKLDVKLPAELLELSEMIAKNVHEIWAQSRMAEGWTYGPRQATDPLLSPL